MNIEIYICRQVYVWACCNINTNVLLHHFIKKTNTKITHIDRPIVFVSLTVWCGHHGPEVYLQGHWLSGTLLVWLRSSIHRPQYTPAQPDTPGKQPIITIDQYFPHSDCKEWSLKHITHRTILKGAVLIEFVTSCLSVSSSNVFVTA